MAISTVDIETSHILLKAFFKFLAGKGKLHMDLTPAVKILTQCGGTSLHHN